MSCSHHQSAAEYEAMSRLVDQIMGRAQEEFSEGRLHKQDEGDLGFAVAADPMNNVVLIHFGKPVTWIGFNRKQASMLVNLLNEKIDQIK